LRRAEHDLETLNEIDTTRQLQVIEDEETRQLLEKLLEEYYLEEPLLTGRDLYSPVGPLLTGRDLR
jgi:hypothetical protein